jgi:SH3 domain protein
MNRFRSALALATVLVILVPAGTALAVKLFTTDTQELLLRASPSSDSKSLASIPPASSVELVNPHAYTKVRYIKPNGEVREGWIPTKFLNSQPPDSSVTRELKTENEAIKERLDEVDKEKAGLSQRERDLSDKLTQLNAAYEELKGGSVNYLKLKSEYDSAKSSLASAQEHIQTMVQENENLKLSQRVHWFVAGAFVLLLGWFIGWATGKRQKKRKKGSYYY